MNNGIPEPNLNQGPTMQPQNNLNITQSINPQQNTLNNLNTDQPKQPPMPPLPPKKGKGPLVIIILLILIILGLAGYICYDKFIAKDNKCDVEKTTETDSSEVSANEYTSLDGKEYLKLKDDNTYELKYADVTQDQKYITNNGKYTKTEDGYKLDNKISVLKEKDLIEIDGLIQDDEIMKESKILFNKENLTTINESINKSVTNNVKSIITLKGNENALPVDTVKLNEGINCFRYAFEGEKIDRSNITCGVSYKIYFKDYKETECNSEMSNSAQASKLKYMPYMVPAGECKKDYISYGIFYSFDQNNNYKTLSTFSGL